VSQIADGLYRAMSTNVSDVIGDVVANWAILGADLQWVSEGSRDRIMVPKGFIAD
jgi:hypothetical protein